MFHWTGFCGRELQPGKVSHSSYFPSIPPFNPLSGELAQNHIKKRAAIKSCPSITPFFSFFTTTSVLSPGIMVGNCLSTCELYIVNAFGSFDPNFKLYFRLLQAAYFSFSDSPEFFFKSSLILLTWIIHKKIISRRDAKAQSFLLFVNYKVSLHCQILFTKTR